MEKFIFKLKTLIVQQNIFLINLGKIFFWKNYLVYNLKIDSFIKIIIYLYHSYIYNKNWDLIFRINKIFNLPLNLCLFLEILLIP